MRPENCTVLMEPLASILMKIIKCAVVGIGYIGKFHAQKFAMLPQAKLVALADVNVEHAQLVIGGLSELGYKGIEIFSNYRDLIGKVDAVSIAVPTKAHYEVAKFFLEHGVHVLLEKPITSTLEEADQLIKIAKEQNVILQIGHLERFNAVNHALEGVLKEPLFIEAHRLAPYNPRGADVNVVLDIMIHDIDLILSMVNYSPILSLDACGGPVLSDDVDIANARIKFTNGCVANVTASRASLKTERKFKIFQHDAYLSIDFQHRRVVVHRKGEEEMFPGIPEITYEEHEFEQSDAIRSEIFAFLRSIAEGIPPMVSGEAGRAALETAIKITESLHQQLDYIKENHPLYF